MKTISGTTLSVLSVLAAFAAASATTLGPGSYRDGLPTAAPGPATSPRVTSDFVGHPNTNDWSSSAVFSTDPATKFSFAMFAYPLLFKTDGNGLGVGYETGMGTHSTGYIWGQGQQFSIGLSGQTFDDVKVFAASDWTTGLRFEKNGQKLDATIGHGLPFVYCRFSGGTPMLAATSAPVVWRTDNNVLGIRVGAFNYGLFAPTGASWTVNGSTIALNAPGKDYFSVALLPDGETATLDRFKASAFRFVTGSEATWRLDDATATVQATYALRAEDLEPSQSPVPQALLRHQYLLLDGNPELRGNAYVSPRGELKLLFADSFSTSGKFDGIVPSFPVAALDETARARLSAQLEADYAAYSGTHFTAYDTYYHGKELGKLAALVRLAHDLGKDAIANGILGWLKENLEDWFTYSGDSDGAYFAYDPVWHQLVGVPASFNSNDQINDHHFHYGYFIQAAAVVAQFDKEWGLRWKPMVELLIRDANNPDASDALFPHLRNFDPYVGHSWASGHANFGDGNNQESVSEGLNFDAGVFLWGAATGDRAMRDLGAWLFHTERMAAEQYWFDMDDAVFPADLELTSTSLIWGGKSDYATWFSAEPEMIQGIIFLPVHWHSLSLGRRPDYCSRNYQNLVTKNGGKETVWRDVIWQYRAFFEPAAALQEWTENGSYDVEQGETKTKTLAWLLSLNAFGTLDTTLQATDPTAIVFAKNGARRYVAWNPTDADRNVVFSNGKGMVVAAGELLSLSEPEMRDDLVSVAKRARPAGAFRATALGDRSLLVSAPSAGRLEIRDASGRALLRRDLSEGTHRISRGEIGGAEGALLVRWKGADGRVWSGGAR